MFRKAWFSVESIFFYSGRKRTVLSRANFVIHRLKLLFTIIIDNKFDSISLIKQTKQKNMKKASVLLDENVTFYPLAGHYHKNSVKYIVFYEWYCAVIKIHHFFHHIFRRWNHNPSANECTCRKYEKLNWKQSLLLNVLDVCGITVIHNIYNIKGSWAEWRLPHHYV